MADTELPKHKRLSQALCEAVEFGRTQKIRMGWDDYYSLLESIEAATAHKVLLSEPSFEGVPLNREDGLTGCYVEHDNRYLEPSSEVSGSAIAETVVFMRDTKRPAIKAW